MTTSEPMTPLKTKIVSFRRLPDHYQEAAYIASEWPDPRWQKRKIRVETYSMHDINHLIGEIWKWDTLLSQIYDFDDIKRVRKIMAQIKKTKLRWPYVSTHAYDMEELQEVTEEDDYLSVPNHGDGWHRIVAFNELKFRKMDILFVEPKCLK